MKSILFALLIVTSLLPTVVFARTSPTFGQNSVGAACNNTEKAFDFDAFAQCNAGTGAGTMQTAPIILGTVTAPPYAATTCDSNKAGMIQWTGSAFQGCDGSNWVSFGGVCSSPSAFSFTDQTEVAPSTTITSDSVSLSGSSFSCAVSASCTGCSDILRNGVSSGATSHVLVAPGDTISLAISSSATASATATASVTVGATTSSVWSVTTTQCPNVGDVCADGSQYAGITPNGNIRMYVERCDYPQTWNGSSCTGTIQYPKWASGVSVTTNRTSAVTGEANSDYLAGLSNADSPYSAAQHCYNATDHGQTDWYLPATQELQLLTANYSTFNMQSTNYWASTESSTVNAVTVKYPTSASADPKTSSTSNRVRCVRK
jgi:hypothetical protein